MGVLPSDHALTLSKCRFLDFSCKNKSWGSLWSIWDLIHWPISLQPSICAICEKFLVSQPAKWSSFNISWKSLGVWCPWLFLGIRLQQFFIAKWGDSWRFATKEVHQAHSSLDSTFARFCRRMLLGRRWANWSTSQLQNPPSRRFNRLPRTIVHIC